MRALIVTLTVWLAAATASAQSLAPRSLATADLEAIAAVPPPSGPAAGTRSETTLDRALRARDWARAEGLLIAEIEKTPDSAALLKTLAGVFLANRKPLNAAIALKKAEALAPLDSESRMRLVLAYIALKRRDWARPELERLVEADPSNTKYQYWLGRLDYDDGRYDSAVQRLRTVATQEPTFARAFDNLGLCYEALNQPDRAIVEYREANRLNRQATEKSAWPALNLGILLHSRGELPEAERLFREAVGYEGGLAAAHYQLGVLLEQTERVDAAIAELGLAATADPSYAAPHYALARIYRRQGRTADAAAALATFQQLTEQASAGRR
jgi:tetratricopeptide (TPR) repeat protein